LLDHLSQKYLMNPKNLMFPMFPIPQHYPPHLKNLMFRLNLKFRL